MLVIVKKNNLINFSLFLTKKNNENDLGRAFLELSSILAGIFAWCLQLNLTHVIVICNYQALL